MGDIHLKIVFLLSLVLKINKIYIPHNFTNNNNNTNKSNFIKSTYF